LRTCWSFVISRPDGLDFSLRQDATKGRGRTKPITFFARSSNYAKYGPHVIRTKNFLPFPQGWRAGTFYAFPSAESSFSSVEQSWIAANFAGDSAVHRQIYEVYPLMAANGRQYSRYFSHNKIIAENALFFKRPRSRCSHSTLLK